MKRIALITMLALLATFAVAQTPQSGAPAKPATSQAQPAASSQTPAAGQPPAASQAPAGKRPPQAKTQPELTEFQAALGNADVKAAQRAADEFATKYPDSELKWLLYQQIMLKAQAANDEDTMIAAGRKSIQANPDNALSLAMVAMIIAERTRDTDLDKDEKTAEATKDANHAIETVNDLQVAANATPEQLAMVHNQVRSIAYGALGTLDFNNKNDARAVENLRNSLSIPGVPVDPLNALRLAVALDHQQKYAEALDVANKALAQAQEPFATQLRQERDRLLKLTGSGAATPAPGSPSAGTTAGAAKPPAPATPAKPPQL